MHLAAIGGHIEIVELLLNRGFNVNTPSLKARVKLAVKYISLTCVCT